MRKLALISFSLILMIVVSGLVLAQQKDEKEPPLPDFLQAPYQQKYEVPNSSIFHKEWGKIHSVIYNDKLHDDKNGNANAIAVFSDENSQNDPKYAEWKHYEKNNDGYLLTLRGYRYNKETKSFEFEQKKIRELKPE